MRKLIYILFIFAFFSACQDDDANFETDVLETVTFDPIPGGAVMRYKLPADDAIFWLKVRYTDAEGNRILRVGSYASDTVTIIGFNEAREGVEAEVTLCNAQNVETKPTIFKFNTLNSGPVEFFEGARVEPYWNGFRVIYEENKNASGFAHVLYAGKDPMTKEPDTLLIETVPIKQEGDTINFSLALGSSSNTVVIRTEDYRGYMIKQQVWKDVESYSINKLDPKTFDFSAQNPFLIIENDGFKMGKKYLFDGETKGMEAFTSGASVNDTFYTFLAGPNAVGEPFILEFGEAETPAFLRIYGMLNVFFLSNMPNNYYWVGATYALRLPQIVNVYVSNDKMTWEKLGHFEDSSTDALQSWVRRCCGLAADLMLKSVDEIEAAEPAYLTVAFPPSEKKWRYMKIVVDKVFNDTGNYVTMQELEVYVKAK
jgi:hypothetical protein